MKMKKIFVAGNNELLLFVYRMVRLRSPSELCRIGKPVRSLSGAEESPRLILLFLFFSNCGILFLDAPPKKNAFSPFLAFLFQKSNTSEVQDRSAVTVFQTTPVASATNVKINQTITILFSKEIQTSSIPSPALVLSDGTNTISSNGTVSGQTYVFQPSQPLAYNTSYTVTIKSGFKDKVGNALLADYIFTFTTEIAPDLSAFQVVSSSPAQNAVGISVSPPFTVTFNKPPDISSITANSFIITNGTKTYKANFLLNGNVLSIYPFQDLAFATNQTFTLKTTIKDIYGVSLSSDYPISFWTADSTNTPFVISRVPSSIMRGHAMTRPISVTFTKDILPASVNATMFTVTKSGVPVTGTITVSSGTLTFTPTANFTIGTYVATVKQGILATDGTSPTADYQFTFDVKNVAISAGALQTCATLPDGRVRCWGSNEFKTLGVSSISSTNSATSALDLDLNGNYATEVYASALNTCALFTDGGYRCWGEGRFGLQGNGSAFPLFDANVAAGVPAGLGFTHIAIAELYSCGVLLGGKTRCWGTQVGGALGVPDLYEFNSSVLAQNLNVGQNSTAVAVGGESACALLANGNVKCWGKNGSGQLGINNQVDQKDASLASEINFTGIVGSSVKQLVAGGILFYCALLQNGNVRCWGSGANGALGYNSYANVLTPTSAPNVNLGTTATSIYAGQSHVCALLSTGNVKCWGGGTSAAAASALGLLGYFPVIQNNNASVAPSMNLGGTVVQISCGYYHTCAVRSDDTIRCWGNNVYAQLGASAPAAVFQVSSATNINLVY